MNLKKTIGKHIEQGMLRDLKKTLKESVEPYLKPGIKILDIGCEKNGSIEYNEIEIPFTLIGYDSSAEDIRLFNEKFANKKPTTKVINIETLSKLPETYDIIMFSGVIQYLHHPNKTLTIIYNALNPNGIFVIATLNNNNWLRRLHVISRRIKTEAGEQHIYSDKELEDILIKNKFHIITKKSSDLIALPRTIQTNLIYVCTREP